SRGKPPLGLHAEADCHRRHTGPNGRRGVEDGQLVRKNGAETPQHALTKGGSSPCGEPELCQVGKDQGVAVHPDRPPKRSPLQPWPYLSSVFPPPSGPWDRHRPGGASVLRGRSSDVDPLRRRRRHGLLGASRGETRALTHEPCL